MANEFRSVAAEAIHETVSDLHNVGGIDEDMKRRFDDLCLIPAEWDLDVVREFYAERGLDFDKLGPRSYSRKGTMNDKREAGDMFYREYAEFLSRRARK